MSRPGRKGTAVWLLSFFTMLAVVSVFNAIFQLNMNGTAATVYFRVFSFELGSLNVETYLWTSLIAALVLFGLTSLSIYRGLPVDPQVLQRIGQVEEKLAVNSNMIENTQVGFFRKLEESENVNQDVFRKININLDDMKKEASDNLLKQMATIEKMAEESRKNAETIKRQTTELAKMYKKIEKLEKDTLGEKPMLTSQTKLDKVRGIPPHLANKLNQIQTTRVSELLAADPVSLAVKSAEPVETIEDVQARAQLLMVPGIDEDNAELLVKYGVTSRKELANQDPVHLYRGIVGIAKTYVEQRKLEANKVPTVEDVSSWVRQAQL